MVSGSLASIHYGEPRLTMDVDLVVHSGGEEPSLLAKLFSAFFLRGFSGGGCYRT